VPESATAPHLATARSLAEELTGWRRHFHAQPELAYEEHETTRDIAAAVEGMGLTPVRRTPTGLWVDIAGTAGEGPTVLVRADIDGLPVQEATGLPFASRNTGRMHACGHDAHIAMALGVVRTLTAHRDRIRGTVRVLFQPAEEGGAGAVQMIDAGALDGVSRAIGLHIFALAPQGPMGTGHVYLASGPIMAASDRFEIVVRGRGGHGSMPHIAVDTIPIAAQIVTAMQQVVARQLNPQRAAVLTVGTIRGGFAANVIAPEVQMSGTVRTFDPEVKATLRARLDVIVRQTAAAFGAEATLDYKDGYPVVVNDEATVAVMRRAVDDILGEGAVVALDPIMGSEDFSYIGERVPSAYLHMGAANPDAFAPAANHDPHFTIDEAALPIGTAILADTALRLLDQPV